MRKIKLGSVACLVIACLCGTGSYALTRSPHFSGGEYEYAVGTSSAAIVATQSPFLYKLTHPVAGESARWEGDVHEHLLHTFGATVLFTERAGDTLHYYCHASLLGRGILLNGHAVNLHIAVGEGRTTAGTPVIFGGA